MIIEFKRHYARQWEPFRLNRSDQLTNFSLTKLGSVSPTQLEILFRNSVIYKNTAVEEKCLNKSVARGHFFPLLKVSDCTKVDFIYECYFFRKRLRRFEREERRERKEREREIDRERDRESERERDWQTNRQTDRLTERGERWQEG